MSQPKIAAHAFHLPCFHGRYFLSCFQTPLGCFFFVDSLLALLVSLRVWRFLTSATTSQHAPHQRIRFPGRIELFVGADADSRPSRWEQ